MSSAVTPAPLTCSAKHLCAMPGAPIERSIHHCINCGEKVHGALCAHKINETRVSIVAEFLSERAQAYLNNDSALLCYFCHAETHLSDEARSGSEEEGGNIPSPTTTTMRRLSTLRKISSKTFFVLETHFYMPKRKQANMNLSQSFDSAIFLDCKPIICTMNTLEGSFTQTCITLLAYQ